MFFKAIFIGRSESGRSCNNASLHAEYATFPKDTMAAGLMILNSSFKKGKLSLIQLSGMVPPDFPFSRIPRTAFVKKRRCRLGRLGGPNSQPAFRARH